MPIKPYLNCLEPAVDAAIWRFLDLWKFRDLMASEELYFRRADLYPDDSEGLPTEDYAQRVLGHNPYDVRDRESLNNHLGSMAQHRESYYINCWHLYREETLDMWEQYGHDGVAVCSRYELLKAAIGGFLDETHLGLVRYGTGHLANRFNALDFITTKRPQYEPDREVRAIVVAYDPLGSGNRHIGLDNSVHPGPLTVNPRHSWVPDCKRRRIDLRALVSGVVMSPWAEPDAVEEINLWIQRKEFPAATRSGLTGVHTPTLDEFRKHRHIAGVRPPEPRAPEDRDPSKNELQELYDLLSTLPSARVRFLYRQRWEACRLCPGTIPRLGDAQYLETTLRLLHDWKRQKIDVG